MAYERLYGPLGGQRDDYLAAMIAATFSATFAGKKDKPPKLSDFIPDWEEASRGDDS
jgi:hypothetical protein